MAFISETAFFGRNLEFAIGPPALTSFPLVKAGKVLSYNFVCLVALYTFRTLVPGCDSPFRVKQEDSVILYTFNEKTEISSV